ncbi:MAG TPA: PHP domain-containing protein [Candidatus Atribacteria bacterium]|nr:PHP domain-containing protein [Candidatus Atribacteria bacterium]
MTKSNRQAAVDLHIHSSLSPCCDDDMTPNNIVNMALLNGLDAIAVTDHNSCDNVEAVIKAARGRLVVVPGMELQTSEEVHILCYFPDLDSLMSFQDRISAFYDGVENKPDLFGNQFIMNERDEVIGFRKQLLLASLNISIDEALQYARSLGGIVVPAHVDRPSYSIISQLGFIPEYMGFTLLEYSQKSSVENYISRKYKLITSSDAHSLGSILERKMIIPVEEITLEGIFNYLSS